MLPDEDAPVLRMIPTTDGLHVALHDHRGEGQPVLLCHATGFHGAVWEPVVEALGAAFACRALDFRGHGASTVPEGLDLGWHGMADDVLAAVDDLGAPPGQLLGAGHSMGGAALLLAELARPGTFRALWLFEPITPPPAALAALAGGNRLSDVARRRRPSFPSRAEALENFAAKPPLRVLRADALHAYVRHGLVDGEDGQVHLACRPEDESQIYRGGGAHGAFDRLDAVGCPVVVACGEETEGPAMFAPAVVDRLPRGRLEVHADLGHFGPLQAPGHAASAIRALAAAV